MQQINLYLPEFRPNRDPLRSVHMLWGSVVLTVLLIFFSVYSSYHNAQLRQQIAAEQEALQAAQQQLQKLALQQPQNLRAQLDQEVLQLQTERKRRELLLTLISRQDLGNTSGFSAQLQTLARQSLESIALERFSLQQGGSYVELSGTTHSADQVPVYIQRLRSESSFAKVGFGVLRVERPENKTAPLRFSFFKPQPQDNADGAGDYFADDKVGGSAR